MSELTDKLLTHAAIAEKHGGKIGEGGAVCREAAKRIEELEGEVRAYEAKHDKHRLV